MAPSPPAEKRQMSRSLEMGRGDWICLNLMTAINYWNMNQFLDPTHRCVSAEPLRDYLLSYSNSNRSDKMRPLMP